MDSSEENQANMSQSTGEIPEVNEDGHDVILNSVLDEDDGTPENMEPPVNVNNTEDTIVVEDISSSDDEEDGIIHLSVKLLDNSIYEFDVSKKISVLEFKHCVAEKAPMEVDIQRLIFQGKVLANEKQLKDYGVENGVVLHLVQKRPAPASTSTSSTTSSTSTTTETNVSPPSPPYYFPHLVTVLGSVEHKLSDRSTLSPPPPFPENLPDEQSELDEITRRTKVVLQSLGETLTVEIAAEVGVIVEKMGILLTLLGPQLNPTTRHRHGGTHTRTFSSGPSHRIQVHMLQDFMHPGRQRHGSNSPSRIMRSSSGGAARSEGEVNIPQSTFHHIQSHVVGGNDTQPQTRHWSGTFHVNPQGTTTSTGEVNSNPTSTPSTSSGEGTSSEPSSTGGENGGPTLDFSSLLRSVVSSVGQAMGDQEGGSEGEPPAGNIATSTASTATASSATETSSTSSAGTNTGTTSTSSATPIPININLSAMMNSLGPLVSQLLQPQRQAHPPSEGEVQAQASASSDRSTNTMTEAQTNDTNDMEIDVDEGTNQDTNDAGGNEVDLLESALNDLSDDDYEDAAASFEDEVNVVSTGDDTDATTGELNDSSLHETTTATAENGDNNMDNVDILDDMLNLLDETPPTPTVSSSSSSTTSTQPISNPFSLYSKPTQKESPPSNSQEDFVLPNDWLAVVSRDEEEQKKQPRQKPLSDSYLLGAPAAKRRKVADITHSSSENEKMEEDEPDDVD